MEFASALQLQPFTLCTMFTMLWISNLHLADVSTNMTCMQLIHTAFSPWSNVGTNNTRSSPMYRHVMSRVQCNLFSFLNKHLLLWSQCFLCLRSVCSFTIWLLVVVLSVHWSCTQERPEQVLSMCNLLIYCFYFIQMHTAIIYQLLSIAEGFSCTNCVVYLQLWFVQTKRNSLCRHAIAITTAASWKARLSSRWWGSLSDQVCPCSEKCKTNGWTGYVRTKATGLRIRCTVLV